MHPPDTKAAWKRRALRAEQQVELLQRMLDTVQAADRRLLYDLVDARVTLDEIAETMERYRHMRQTQERAAADRRNPAAATSTNGYTNEV